MPSANSTMPGSQSNLRAANAARRSRRVRAASRAAMPLRSVPDDAAVGEALGTLLVCDALRDLREQALAHLGAAVIEEQRAVVVQVQEGARLVVVRRRERDAEL